MTHHGDVARFKDGKFDRYVWGLRIVGEGHETKRVSRPGSGVSFIPKDLCNQMEFNSLVHFNQLDVHLACNCHKLEVPMIGLFHEKGYIRYTPPPGPNLYDSVTRASGYIEKVRQIYASYGLSLDSIPEEEWELEGVRNRPLSFAMQDSPEAVNIESGTSERNVNTIAITRWAGRLNNNLIQLLNCINIAQTQQYHEIHFPAHADLSGTKIIISQDRYPEKQSLKGDFFDHFRNIPIDFKQRKKDFAKHIRPLLKLSIDPELQEDIVVYIRGGDTLSHGGLTQPPLYFYQQMLKKYRKQKKPIRLICEDMSNPCAKWLVENKWVTWQKQSLEADISYMANAKVFCMAYGTFSFLPIMLSAVMEELWIPDYIIQELKRGYTDYRDLCEGGIVHQVYLGEAFKHIQRDHSKNWKQIMLEYKPECLELSESRLKRFSILTPSRNRPVRLKTFIDSVFELCEFKHRVEMMVYIDSDDPSIDEYRQLEADIPYAVKFIYGEPMSVSKSWNILAEQCSGDVFIWVMMM